MCVTALAVLAGCTGTDEPPPGSHQCDEGAHTTVSAIDGGGRHWRTELPTVTDRPPQITGGHVLVSGYCGYTVLDLRSGDIMRTGTGRGTVGLAGDLVFTVDDQTWMDDPDSPSYVVSGESVDAKEGSDVDVRYGYGDEQLRGLVVDQSLYVVSDDQSVERYTAAGTPVWASTLPVVRTPVAAHAGDVVVLASAEGSIYGLGLDDGSILWRHSVETSKPTYAMSLRTRGSVVVVTVRPGAGHGPEVLALDAETGSRVAGAPRADPKVPPLSARADGWLVSIESVPPAGHGD